MPTTKEQLTERAQLVRVHEANCNIPYPTPIEANFRLAIMKKLAAEYGLKELRTATIGPIGTKDEGRGSSALNLK